MSIQMVLLPVFVQVALTFVLMFSMGAVRTTSIRRGEVKIREIALGQQAWGEQTLKVGNSFNNQFQLPLLFYVLVVLAIATRQADLLFVIMSWLFVAARLVHAWIHIGKNYVPYRFYAYLAGAFVLTLMWAIFAIRILIAV
jgi:hypothetical protein